eukprot:CAMPEP_0119083520 /NCGR_PEP_ID=MMETSP1178-20130426/125842_1 /TAXON_ID=33656 /ORGANISM="unid sp, Strain CCMP2000" /LENGTH=46 /DNA_ID= /DNA_START= /DNA_END= /DNA_ORIENTATION=
MDLAPTPAAAARCIAVMEWCALRVSERRELVPRPAAEYLLQLVWWP